MLQNKLDAIRATFESKAPPGALAIVRRATEDLIASDQALLALRAGDPAPVFELPDENGDQVSSSDLIAAGPLVVTFHRGVWCPYCNVDLEAIESAAATIRRHGASLVAISPQTGINSCKMKTDTELSFPLLTDFGNRIANQFGLRFKMPDELIDLYKDFRIDLPSVNGDSSWTLPMPGRFVIDQSGIIAYAEVNPDYTRRPDPEELFPVLRYLQSSGAA